MGVGMGRLPEAAGSAAPVIARVVRARRSGRRHRASVLAVWSFGATDNHVPCVCGLSALARHGPGESVRLPPARAAPAPDRARPWDAR